MKYMIDINFIQDYS